MPEVQIEIGGRQFAVACQEGEEPYLHAAAKMLDTEAAVILGQIGRMPADRMLLMAGLMLADKTAALEDEIKTLQGRIAAQEKSLASAEERLADRARRIGELQARRATHRIARPLHRWSGRTCRARRGHRQRTGRAPRLTLAGAGAQLPSDNDVFRPPKRSCVDEGTGFRPAHGGVKGPRAALAATTARDASSRPRLRKRSKAVCSRRVPRPAPRASGKT